jgi:hypothetical protein
MPTSVQLASRADLRSSDERQLRVDLYRCREFACWRARHARSARARSLFDDAALLAAEWVFKPASMRVLSEAHATTGKILMHAEVAEHGEVRRG